MFAVRRLPYKPVRRAPSDPNKKRAQASRGHQLDLDIEALVSMLVKSCDELAAKYGRSKAYIRAKVFGGSKSKAFINRRRVSSTVRIWDAYVHVRSKEFNSDEEVAKRGRKLKLAEIRAAILLEERSWKDFPEEDQQRWVQAHREHKAARNVEKRPNLKAEQQDASTTYRMIGREMEALSIRTGTKSVFFSVRSGETQLITPFYVCSPDILQFFTIVVGKTLDWIIGKFELWALGGMQAVLGIAGQSKDETRNDVRRLVQAGYHQILEQRYADRADPPQDKMNYKSYDEAVVKKHGVRLVGWTANGGVVCQPGKITGVEEIRQLYTALFTQSCRWELIPDYEWDPADHRPQKRKRRSDANVPRGPRKKRKTSETDAASTSAKPAATKTAAARKTRGAKSGPSSQKRAKKPAAEDDDDPSDDTDDEDSDDPDDDDGDGAED